MVVAGVPSASIEKPRVKISDDGEEEDYTSG
jgi:hypothetical protein